MKPDFVLCLKSGTKKSKSFTWPKVNATKISHDYNKLMKFARDGHGYIMDDSLIRRKHHIVLFMIQITG